MEHVQGWVLLRAIDKKAVAVDLRLMASGLQYDKDVQSTKQRYVHNILDGRKPAKKFVFLDLDWT
jgi:hypothetical protein